MLIRLFVATLVFFVGLGWNWVSAQQVGAGIIPMAPAPGVIVGSDLVNNSHLDGGVPGLEPRSGFSGRLVFFGQKHLLKSEVLIVRLEEDPSSRSSELLPTKERFSVGNCRRPDSTSSFLLRQVSDCISANGEWATGGMSFREGYYSIRAYADGFFHPLWDERIVYHSGAGVINLFNIYLYPLNIRAEKVVVARPRNNQVLLGFLLVNSGNWSEPILFRASVRGPSYTKEDALLAEYPLQGAWVPRNFEKLIPFAFGIPEYTGFDGRGFICGHIELVSAWNPAWVYVRTYACIPADLVEKPFEKG